MHTFAAAVAVCLLGLSSWPTVGWSQGRRVEEREANNSFATATPAELGDTLVGEYDPRCDKDFYVLDIPAGTRINFQGGPAYINVWRSADSLIAGQIGDRPPPRDVPIVVGGLYYLSLSYPFHEEPSDCAGQMPNSGYRVRVDGVPDPLGPGDPPRPAFLHLDQPIARVTVGESTELWAHTERGAVTRINSDGSVDVLVEELSDAENSGPYGEPYAMDGMGNLLVPGTVRASDGHDSSMVWRVDPRSGAVTVFTSGRFYWSRLKLAVADNGDVWMGPAWRWGVDGTSDGRTYLWRVDPLGSLLDSVELASLRPEPFHSLTVSPTGDPYLGGYYGVHRIVDRTIELVIPRDSGDIKSVAFDRDGYLYAVKGTTNADHRVALYDPSFHLIDDTLAHLPFRAFEYKLLFAPDRAGNPRGRLLALSFFGGTNTHFVELNPAGIRAPGYRPPRLLPISRLDSSLIAGVSYADTLRMLDAPGPVQWSVASGDLPDGLTLSETTGEFTGVPRQSGSFVFSVRARSGNRYGYARFTIIVAPLTVSVENVVDALLGASSLSPAAREQLDQIGNRNGVLDVGDLRAFLRSRGMLPASAARSDFNPTSTPARRGPPR